MRLATFTTITAATVLSVADQRSMIEILNALWAFAGSWKAA
jgi:hypothetical protein